MTLDGFGVAEDHRDQGYLKLGCRVVVNSSTDRYHASLYVTLRGICSE